MQMPAKSLFTAAAVAVLALAAPTTATTFDFEVGRSYSNSHGTDAEFVESIFDASPIGSSRFSWEHDVSLGWISGRDLYNTTMSTDTTRARMPSCWAVVRAFSTVSGAIGTGTCSSVSSRPTTLAAHPR
jgi:hypothetical protein